jgi:2-oxoglutarate ferredoxin oxidoreductase subunit beta
LDIISPCVTFNNRDESTKSYSWGKEHETPLHDVTYVPAREEIRVDYEPGETTSVKMHDGSTLVLQKLDRDYDPTDRMQATHLLEEARTNQKLITGLLYLNRDQAPLPEAENLPEEPLASLPEDKLRPSESSLTKIMAEFA